jgi:hypothetical protein
MLSCYRSVTVLPVAFRYPFVISESVVKNITCKFDEHNLYVVSPILHRFLRSRMIGVTILQSRTTRFWLKVFSA